MSFKTKESVISHARLREIARAHDSAITAVKGVMYSRCVKYSPKLGSVCGRQIANDSHFHTVHNCFFGHENSGGNSYAADQISCPKCSRCIKRDVFENHVWEEIGIVDELMTQFVIAGFRVPKEIDKNCYNTQSSTFLQERWCWICERKIINDDIFMFHLKIVHRFDAMCFVEFPLTQSSSGRLRQWVCPLCGMKFASESVVYLHVTRICSRIFSNTTEMSIMKEIAGLGLDGTNISQEPPEISKQHVRSPRPTAAPKSPARRNKPQRIRQTSQQAESTVPDESGFVYRAEVDPTSMHNYADVGGTNVPQVTVGRHPINTDAITVIDDTVPTTQQQQSAPHSARDRATSGASSNSSSVNNRPYPCAVCDATVSRKDYSIKCVFCDKWTHAKCSGIPHTRFSRNLITPEEVSHFQCSKCCSGDSECDEVLIAHSNVPVTVQVDAPDAASNAYATDPMVDQEPVILTNACLPDSESGVAVVPQNTTTGGESFTGRASTDPGAATSPDVEVIDLESPMQSNTSGSSGIGIDSIHQQNIATSSGVTDVAMHAEHQSQNTVRMSERYSAVDRQLLSLDGESTQRCSTDSDDGLEAVTLLQGLDDDIGNFPLDDQEINFDNFLVDERTPSTDQPEIEVLSPEATDLNSLTAGAATPACRDTEIVTGVLSELMNKVDCIVALIFATNKGFDESLELLDNGIIVAELLRDMTAKVTDKLAQEDECLVLFDRNQNDDAEIEVLGEIKVEQIEDEPRVVDNVAANVLDVYEHLQHTLSGDNRSAYATGVQDAILASTFTQSTELPQNFISRLLNFPNTPSQLTLPWGGQSQQEVYEVHSDDDDDVVYEQTLELGPSVSTSQSVDTPQQTSALSLISTTHHLDDHYPNPLQPESTVPNIEVCHEAVNANSIAGNSLSRNSRPPPSFRQNPSAGQARVYKVSADTLAKAQGRPAGENTVHMATAERPDGSTKVCNRCENEICLCNRHAYSDLYTDSGTDGCTRKDKETTFLDLVTKLKKRLEGGENLQTKQSENDDAKSGKKGNVASKPLDIVNDKQARSKLMRDLLSVHKRRKVGTTTDSNNIYSQVDNILEASRFGVGLGDHSATIIATEGSPIYPRPLDVWEDSQNQEDPNFRLQHLRATGELAPLPASKPGPLSVKMKRKKGSYKNDDEYVPSAASDADSDDGVSSRLRKRRQLPPVPPPTQRTEAVVVWGRFPSSTPRAPDVRQDRLDEKLMSLLSTGGDDVSSTSTENQPKALKVKKPSRIEHIRQHYQRDVMSGLNVKKRRGPTEQGAVSLCVTISKRYAEGCVRTMHIAVGTDVPLDTTAMRSPEPEANEFPPTSMSKEANEWPSDDDDITVEYSFEVGEIQVSSAANIDPVGIAKTTAVSAISQKGDEIVIQDGSNDGSQNLSKPPECLENRSADKSGQPSKGTSAGSSYRWRLPVPKPRLKPNFLKPSRYVPKPKCKKSLKSTEDVAWASDSDNGGDFEDDPDDEDYDPKTDVCFDPYKDTYVKRHRRPKMSGICAAIAAAARLRRVHERATDAIYRPWKSVGFVSRIQQQRQAALRRRLLLKSRQPLLVFKKKRRRGLKTLNPANTIFMDNGKERPDLSQVEEQSDDVIIEGSNSRGTCSSRVSEHSLYSVPDSDSVGTDISQTECQKVSNYNVPVVGGIEPRSAKQKKKVKNPSKTNKNVLPDYSVTMDMELDYGGPRQRKINKKLGRPRKHREDVVETVVKRTRAVMKAEETKRFLESIYSPMAEVAPPKQPLIGPKPQMQDQEMQTDKKEDDDDDEDGEKESPQVESTGVMHGPVFKFKPATSTPSSTSNTSPETSAAVVSSNSIVCKTLNSVFASKSTSSTQSGTSPTPPGSDATQPTADVSPPGSARAPASQIAPSLHVSSLATTITTANVIGSSPPGRIITVQAGSRSSLAALIAKRQSLAKYQIAVESSPPSTNQAGVRKIITLQPSTQIASAAAEKQISPGPSIKVQAYSGSRSLANRAARRTTDSTLIKTGEALNQPPPRIVKSIDLDLELPETSTTSTTSTDARTSAGGGSFQNSDLPHIPSQVGGAPYTPSPLTVRARKSVPHPEQLRAGYHRRSEAETAAKLESSSSLSCSGTTEHRVPAGKLPLPTTEAESQKLRNAMAEFFGQKARKTVFTGPASKKARFENKTGTVSASEIVSKPTSEQFSHNIPPSAERVCNDGASIQVENNADRDNHEHFKPQSDASSHLELDTTEPQAHNSAHETRVTESSPTASITIGNSLPVNQPTVTNVVTLDSDDSSESEGVPNLNAPADTVSADATSIPTPTTCINNIVPSSPVLVKTPSNSNEYVAVGYDCVTNSNAASTSRGVQPTCSQSCDAVTRRCDPTMDVLAEGACPKNNTDCLDTDPTGVLDNIASSSTTNCIQELEGIRTRASRKAATNTRKKSPGKKGSRPPQGLPVSIKDNRQLIRLAPRNDDENSNESGTSGEIIVDIMDDSSDKNTTAGSLKSTVAAIDMPTISPNASASQISPVSVTPIPELEPVYLSDDEPETTPIRITRSLSKDSSQDPQKVIVESID